MQYKWKVFIFLTYIFSVSLQAAEEDTTKMYHANDVVITATRSVISPYDAPSPVQIVSSSTIQQINGTTLADLLHLINGVNINYYGAVGGVKNLAFRGLSTENSLVLVNGSPINDPQNGAVDLSLFPVETIDHMEILNGGASALYGGSALGGVVNILTRRASNDFRVHAQGEVGSLGAVRIFANVQGRTGGAGIFGGFSREYGNDNYQFIFQRQGLSDTTLTRMNADYQRTQVYVNGDYQIADMININTSLQYIQFKRGVPGPIYSPVGLSVARQNDKTMRAMLGSQIKLQDQLLITFNIILSKNSELYRDFREYTDVTYVNKNYMINGQIEWSPIVWDRFIVGGEFGEGLLDGDGVSFGAPFIMHPVRVQKSIYLSNESVYQSEKNWFDRMSFYQSIRYDYYSDIYEDAISPKLGLNFRIYQPYNIHVRCSWGKNFRVPTFNDKYFPLFGNPSLNPERSTAVDIGVVGALDSDGRQVIQITYFEINSEKKIAFNGSLPYNIGEAKNSGLEIRYDCKSINNKFDAYFGLSFTNAVKKNRSGSIDPTFNKQLRYVPKNLGIFGISFDTEVGMFTVHQTLTGLRYTTDDESRSLPAYTLTDINFQKKLEYGSLGLLLQCSINNVFDIGYQTFEGYPMPGRTFRIGCGVTY